MKIYEIGTGYTSIPAQMGAATEIVVEELTRSFLKLNKDVEIIDVADDNRAETDLPIMDVKVPSMFTKADVSLGIVHKLKRVVYSVALAQKLSKILKNSKEEIVLHFHNQYNMFFFLKIVPEKYRKKAKTAYTVHSYIWGTKWEEIESTIKKKYFQEVYCVKNADVVFVLNDITKEHFVNRLEVSRENIFKIINGVSLDKYKPLDAIQLDNIKNALDLNNKKIIFQVGSICERKNQLGSLELLCEYMQEHSEVVYMYAGGVIDGEYQRSIINLAKEKGLKDQVIYIGELTPGNQLNEYYNIADCSVFTSKLESFGLVIVEAIAAGTSVVVSGKPMFELEHGYYVYSNKDEFIDIINRMLNDSILSKADNQEVIDKYDWDSVAKNYLKVFEN